MPQETNIQIQNQQTIKKVNLKALKKYLSDILKASDIPSKKISVLICDNKFIKSLNKKYFKKNQATDVIAFPLADNIDPDYLGEVVVSLEQALIVAKELNLKWRQELILYLIHGLLHLVGFSDLNSVDKKLMDSKQEQIREIFFQNSPKVKF